jgi:hypothetical protein
MEIFTRSSVWITHTSFFVQSEECGYNALSTHCAFRIELSIVGSFGYVCKTAERSN